MNETEAVAAFGALSNETRLRILRELVVAGAAGCGAGDLAIAVGASPSRASFHLAALAKSGLIRSSQTARQVTYFANFEKIGGLLRYFWKDCCSSDARIRACCFDKGEC